MNAPFWSSRWSPRAWIAVAIAATAVSATSCAGGSGHGPIDASAADNRAADERLQGNWRIVDFKPENALDPSMASMLAFYQNSMVVQIQGGRIRALAQGLNFDRRYEVKEALDARFHLVVYDDAGVAQTNYCEFLPDGTMRAKTQTPWRGDALFARAQ